MLPTGPIAEEWKALAPQAPLVPTQPVQGVPAHYFAQLPAQVLDRIKAEADWATEIQSLSPLLAGLSRRSPQTPPPTYFDQAVVKGSTLQEKPQVQPARVVSLRRSLQWAVAACVAGLLVGGAYFLSAPVSPALPSSTALGLSLEQGLSAVGEEEMDQYLQKQHQLSLLSVEDEAVNLDPEQKMEQLSEEELLQYLQQEPATQLAQQAS